MTLLRHVVAVERAGFDGIGASDHLQPRREPGSGATRGCGSARPRRPPNACRSARGAYRARATTRR